MIPSLKYIIITIYIVMFGITANAQLKDKYELKADQAVKKQDFYSAAIYYTKALLLQHENAKVYNPYTGQVLEDKVKNGNNRKKLIFKIAEANRLYYNWDTAGMWYAQAAEFPEEEFQTAKYWNAICLRIKGDYVKASTMLELFLANCTSKDEWTQLATAELANCKFAIEKQQDSALVKFQITKLPTIVNDLSANYAPVLLPNDLLIFTSSRNSWSTNRLNLIPKKSTIKAIDPVNDIFQVVVSKMENVKQINLPIDAMNQGAASFSSDKMHMYFTRWIVENGEKISAIYISNRQKDDKWTEPTLLNNYINVDGYSSKQPFISSDGRFLFFSSDRPGGMGKFDLWVSALNSDGLPRTPATNLGKINTVEDEEAPFYHSRTTQLIFSSNGRRGFGGFDLYSSKGMVGTFTMPQNLGEPFNSPKDDVYFTTLSDEPTSNAFISSDRSSTCCLEIFNISYKK